MALLHSARHDAGNDALLDWLKSGTRWGRHDRHAIAALEARVRRAGVSRVAGLATVPLHDAAAERLRDDAVAVLRPLQGAGSAPLAEWLEATLEALRAGGGLSLLADDAAGTVLLQALLLDLERRQSASSAWPRSSDLSLSLAEFTRWCDEVLEQATFRPEPERLGRCDGRQRRRPRHAARASDAAPLRRGGAARLRRPPRRLAGARGPAAARGRRAGRHRLAGGAAAARAARLRPAAARRAADLAAPRPRRRRVAGAQPARRAASPLAVDPGARRFAPWTDPRTTIEVPPAPVRRAEAIAPGLVPDRLSATALETLRGCPYRFFAHAMLRLNAADEIEAGLDKRDWGNWLHEVLLRFHEGRAPDAEPADDAAALHAAARVVLDEHGLDAADFLPWQASFDAFVPRYLAFMRRRDRGRRALAARRAVVHAALARSRGGAVRHRRPHRRGRR